ncbi:MAG: hypothetical protein ACK4OE_16095 [Acidovorax sp.]|uniref:hypothetical protein n=1 Tax=Acidovorax sp. TaxID=1872122 RepID=UPI00391D4D2C
MNAVATPTRKASKPALKPSKPAASRKEALQDWDQLARYVSNDLAEVTGQIAALADSVGSEPDPLCSIGILLDEAHRYVSEIRESIQTRPLTLWTTNAAYTALLKPLAIVEGAMAMAAKVEADIISPALRVVHEKLDEAQNSLDDQVIGNMLPPAPETEYTAEAIKNAFATIGDLLHAASMTDEPPQWSGDSDRLLRMASRLANEASDRLPAPVDYESIAFDIAALIRGCRVMPGESESSERTGLLGEAEKHLDWLAETTDCCDPGADRPSLRTAQLAVQAEPTDSREEAAYRELARNASYEIQKLAEAMQIVNMQIATEDHPMTNGIMARIILLSEIVFYAAALHGGSRADWEVGLDELQRKFRGAF